MEKKLTSIAVLTKGHSTYPVMTQVLMKGKSIKLPKGNELKREKFREVLKGKTK